VPRAVVSPPSQDMSTTLSLANIRNSLIRQEDTIIFNLIERAQFAKNDVVYTSGGIPVPGFDRSGRRYSLLEYVLREQEQLHGKIRRYTSPDEHPFFPDDVPPLVLPPISYPETLAPCSASININSKIMDVYLHEVLPGITPPGDDFNYGSSSMLDVLCLQALSKRIHYGKFVAEAKFRDQTAKYTALIRARDADGIMELLTDKAVEKRVVERVRAKAFTFGQDITGPLGAAPAPAAAATNGAGQGRLKVCPELVANMYEEWVMPLTKEVEVLYLLARLDNEEGNGAAAKL